MKTLLRSSGGLVAFRGGDFRRQGMSVFLRCFGGLHAADLGEVVLWGRGLLFLKTVEKYLG